MRKILFALDDNRISDAAFAFLKEINRQEPVLVTGMYIPALADDLQWASSAGDAAFYVPRLIEEDEIQVHGNISAFRDACTQNQINYCVHEELEKPVLEGIRRETRFADLLIIGLENYDKEKTKVLAGDELKQIVKNAECPVLLVPSGTSFPENIIIAYDGTEDSVYALKMFAYIFPSLTAQPTTIVYADNRTAEIPEEDYVKELATRHFPQVHFSVLEFNPKKYFVTWMEERPKTMLVSGAYSRSGLSQLFQKSFIDDLLEEYPIPVFIAHR